MGEEETPVARAVLQTNRGQLGRGQLVRGVRENNSLYKKQRNRTGDIAYRRAYRALQHVERGVCAPHLYVPVGRAAASRGHAPYHSLTRNRP